MKIFVLNGPNLNTLGTREPEIYGTATLRDVEKMCKAAGEALDVEIDFRQTNDEGELVGWIQEASDAAQAIVLNPAAFTHYSLALREAISASGLPLVEVHISNIYAREEWRAKSVVSGVARGVIAGLGVRGYLLAIEWLARLLKGE